jgi:hypothetical protein
MKFEKKLRDDLSHRLDVPKPATREAGSLRANGYP